MNMITTPCSLSKQTICEVIALVVLAAIISGVAHFLITSCNLSQIPASIGGASLACIAGIFLLIALDRIVASSSRHWK